MLKPNERYQIFYGKTVEARGWSYFPHTEIKVAPSEVRVHATGGMTAAGLGSLGIIKEIFLTQYPEFFTRTKKRKELLKKTDKSILSGWAWLGKHYTMDHNPAPNGGGGWHNYYRHAVERVGILFGVPNMGKGSWYPDGARVLIASQQDSGFWQSDGIHLNQLVNSDYALLFLDHSTRPPKAPIIPPAVTVN